MKLGPYEVEGELGRGGMGVVYAVRRDGRSLALKWIERDQTPPDMLERFRLEAQALARVSHPHVVTLLDFGSTPRGLYLVMERLAGESLEQRLLQGGPLPADEAAQVLLELCEGVSAAHEVGVLHRDLKPANVLLCPGRGAVLTDFGLARRLDAQDRLTRTGEVLGTPAYMAPEQAYGEKESDARTDVYGLGATLYATLCARQPFEGATVLEVLDAVAHLPPRSPSEHAPVDSALERVCLRCLAKSPQERYASVDELALALRSWQARAPASRSLPLALLGLGGLVALLGGAYAWLAAREAAELADAPVVAGAPGEPPGGPGQPSAEASPAESSAPARPEGSAQPSPPNAPPRPPRPSAQPSPPSRVEAAAPAPQLHAFASWDGGLLRGVLALPGLDAAERDALQRALDFALADPASELEPRELPAATTWAGHVARLALHLVRHRRRIARRRSEPNAGEELRRLGLEAGSYYESAPSKRAEAIAALTFASFQVLQADYTPVGLQRNASAAMALEETLPAFPAAALPAACAVSDLALRPLAQRQPDPMQRARLLTRLGERAATWLELEPKHPVATFRVAETLAQLGRREQALGIALGNPHNPQLYRLGLRLLYRAERFEELDQQTRKVLAAPPRRWGVVILAEVVLWRARAARRLKNPKVAQALLDRYGMVANRDPRLSHLYKLELARLPIPLRVSESLLELGRRAAANAQASSLDRQRGLELQATVYAQREDPLRARIALRHALQLEPLPDDAERLRLALIEQSAPELSAPERDEVAGALADLAAHLPARALARLTQAVQAGGGSSRSHLVTRLLVRAVAETMDPVWRTWSGYEAQGSPKILALGQSLSGKLSAALSEQDPESLGAYLIARARLRFVRCFFGEAAGKEVVLEEARAGLSELKRAEELLAAPPPPQLEEVRSRLELVLAGLGGGGDARAQRLAAARSAIARQRQLLPAESPYASLCSAWLSEQVGDHQGASEQLELAARASFPLSALEQMISLAGARFYGSQQRWRAVLVHTTRGLQAPEIPSRLRFGLSFLHGVAELESGGKPERALVYLEGALEAGEAFPLPVSQRRAVLAAKARAHAALGDEAAAARAREEARALEAAAQPR